MGKLKNVILGPVPIKIDNRISQKISILPTTKISTRIGNLFTGAFIKVADQLEAENMKEIPKCHCVIIGSDEFTYIIENEELGLCVNFCVFPIHKWKNKTDMQILLMIIEELSHFFWSIKDERIVCDKVLEIMKRFKGDLQLTDIYDSKWLEQNQN